MYQPVDASVRLALEQFAIPGILVSLEPLGQGNINDTFLATYQEAGGTRHFVHQRLNTRVFREPDVVMSNMRVVTQHVGARIDQEARLNPGAAGPRLRSLQLVQTRDGRDYVTDAQGGVWRTTSFLDGLETHESIRDTGQAREAGACLGKFHALVSNLDPERLGDSLPGFHHTEKYFAKLESAVSSASGVRLLAESSVATELVEGLFARRHLSTVFCDGLKSGRIPLRTVHNDPKISNFMFDPVSGQAICMIDLDTVKPGLVHYDFGDCLRSATNPLGEETLDFGAVAVDETLFEALATGYCCTAREFLTPEESALLFDAVKIIAFELSVRFLASHLLADGYFKERYPGNNLNRALVQFRLVQDLERKEALLRKVVQRALIC